MTIEELDRRARENGYFVFSTDDFSIYSCRAFVIKAYSKNGKVSIKNVDNNYFNNLSSVEFLKALAEYAEEYLKEKRYWIPLPELYTADGEQQFLSFDGENYFASVMNGQSKQSFTEKELLYVPKMYRQYAQLYYGFEEKEE